MPNTTTTTTTTTPAPINTVDADYADAWRAADLATADLVAFADVVAAVDAGAALFKEARAVGRNAADAAAAWRVFDAVAEVVNANIVDAVADARVRGYESDAVAVVVVAAGRRDAFGLLQRAGVAVVMSDAGAWLAADGERPALSFANVAGALQYATGHAAPTPRRSRRQRRA